MVALVVPAAVVDAMDLVRWSRLLFLVLTSQSLSATEISARSESALIVPARTEAACQHDATTRLQRQGPRLGRYRRYSVLGWANYCIQTTVY
jgi:hypothetical protein